MAEEVTAGLLEESGLRVHWMSPVSLSSCLGGAGFGLVIGSSLSFRIFASRSMMSEVSGRSPVKNVSSVSRSVWQHGKIRQQNLARMNRSSQGAAGAALVHGIVQALIFFDQLGQFPGNEGTRSGAVSS